MELEKDCSPVWNLYQQIINDMKNGTPMWEEFISKATKLHSALKSTLLAVSAFLDAFQKIADAATNARGASKEIGTALTRMCLRHRAIETRMKSFISALSDSLIAPLSERAEEWRRGACSPPAALGREYARDCKRARAELRRRALDAQRCAKKARRAGHEDAQRRADVCNQDVQERRQQLEEMEERALKAALIEERSRFCKLVTLLNPVVECEVAMLAEVGHLQEGNEQLQRHASEPRSLPPASLQVLCDVKATRGGHSPTPTRLGSRESSLCSVASLDSSGERRLSQGSPKSSVSCSTSNASSGGTLPAQHSNNSQDRTDGRIRSVCSADSGFRSSDALNLPPLPGGFFSKLRLYSDRGRAYESQRARTYEPRGRAYELEGRAYEGSDNQSIGSNCTTPGVGDDAELNDDDGECHDGINGAASTTWPDLNDAAQFDRAATAIMGGRPHTISAARECRTRPALSARTFAPQDDGLPGREADRIQRPPLPLRCSSLERPSVPAKSQQIEHKTAKPSSLPPHLTKEISQALYVNMSELATLAAGRAQQHQQQQQHNNSTEQPQQQTQEKVCSESSASESSLESSSGYGSQGAFAGDEHASRAQQHTLDPECEIVTLRREVDPISAARDSFSISLGSLEEAVRSLDEIASQPFATIKCKPSVPKKRPLSMNNAVCRGAGGAGARRGSSASTCSSKPPPPARRSSSITRPAHSHYQEGNMSNQQPESADNLPPPPAFLLQPEAEVQHFSPGINVAETVKQLTEIKHMPASPGLVRRSLQQPPPGRQSPGSPPQLSTFQQSTFQPSTFQQTKAPNLNPIYGQTGHRIMTYIEQNSIYGRKNSATGSSHDIYSLGGARAEEMSRNNHDDSLYGRAPDKKMGSTIYAQPSQIIAGFNNLARRGDVHPPPSPLSRRRGDTSGAPRAHSADRRPSDGLVASLSAKLAPQLSPVTVRRLDGRPFQCATEGGKTKPPQPAMPDKFSATLQACKRQFESRRANALRDAINSQAKADPRTVHTSLMEQIKRGATLKRNKQCNDRSAPNIR